KAHVEAMRSLAFYTAAQLDHAHHNPDPAAKAEAQSGVELFTPIVKAWSTEISTQLVSEALQCFGGMGYIEETGVAQYYRDVRIAQIYEGTTGIQANDLLGRKFLRDQGKTAMRVMGEMQSTLAALNAWESDELKAIGTEFAKALRALTDASQWLGAEGLRVLANSGNLKSMFAGAVPYLLLWGYTAGGWMMAKAAVIAAGKAGEPFYDAKLKTARYYAAHALPKAVAYAEEVMGGGQSTLAVSEDEFDLDRRALALV
ncbi:MAG: acyl-CoA dehydrogenase C-terminal domain-containing protein, partial [Candidatus Eremiobacteraeota bacterium]|nr:acyl-CoA dehydrogenase C-terminal domain-containing protein [Candidatus Eremiobacteraeota bacterium]